MLHIDPAILGKKGPLNAEEWRAIQCHVVIGQLMIQHIPGYKPEVAQAILEHHERCDGTGHPVYQAMDRLLHLSGLQPTCRNPCKSAASFIAGILKRVQAMVLRSGLLKEELLGWLRSDADIPEQSVRCELGDIDLMLNELKWQLRNLLHAFKEFFDRECKSDEGACSTVKAAMETLLDNLS